MRPTVQSVTSTYKATTSAFKFSFSSFSVFGPPPERSVSSSTELIWWPNGPSRLQLLMRCGLVSVTGLGIEPVTSRSLNWCMESLPEVCVLWPAEDWCSVHAGKIFTLNRTNHPHRKQSVWNLPQYIENDSSGSFTFSSVLCTACMSKLWPGGHMRLLSFLIRPHQTWGNLSK